MDPLSLTDAAAGVTLGVGFNRRYSPSYSEMMNRIRAGQIGDVLHVESTHSGPTGYGLKTTYGTSAGTRTSTPSKTPMSF